MREHPATPAHRAAWGVGRVPWAAHLADCVSTVDPPPRYSRGLVLVAWALRRMSDPTPSSFDDPVLKAALKRAVGPEAAPAALRTRVEQALHAEAMAPLKRAAAHRPAGWRNNPLVGLAAAALFIIGIGLIYTNVLRPRDDGTLKELPKQMALDMAAAHDRALVNAALHETKATKDDLPGIRSELKEKARPPGSRRVARKRLGLPGRARRAGRHDRRVRANLQEQDQRRRRLRLLHPRPRVLRHRRGPGVRTDRRRAPDRGVRPQGDRPLHRRVEGLEAGRRRPGQASQPGAEATAGRPNQRRRLRHRRLRQPFRAGAAVSLPNVAWGHLPLRGR